MDETSKKYAFALGREHEICLEELKSVLDRFGFYFDIYRISGNIVFAKIKNFYRKDAQKMTNILGGTIKIYELVGSLGNNITNQVADLIAIERKDAETKINFGISCTNKHFTRQQINSFALGAKKKLKNKINLRYVEAKDELLLNSIQTLKNNLANKGIEFGIFDEEIGILVGLNNPEEWNKRDYDKPAFDKYSGMVPPKLARMMVNLALGQAGITNNELRIIGDDIMPDHDSKFMTHDSQRPLVVDPFCGSGNILMEAIMLGHDVLGSDNSSKATRDSEQNCKWLLEQITKKQEIITKKIPNYKIFEADATDNSLIGNWKLEIGNYDHSVIVSEPYLGEPKKFKTSFNATVGEYAKIYELYLGFLRNLTLLHATYPMLLVCLVFPLVETVDQGQFSLYKECVDEIKKLGYTQVRPTMVYGRDYQVVKREIVMLKLEQI